MPHIFVSSEHGAFTPDGRSTISASLTARVCGYSAHEMPRDDGHFAEDGADILRLVAAYSPADSVRVHALDADYLNRETNARELDYWQTQPERYAPAYYAFPAGDERATDDGRYTVGRRDARRSFFPALWKGHDHTARMEPRTARAEQRAIVTTWNGSVLGYITSARVYVHNFGARMVSLHVRGTNGAHYYGRASWDNGSLIRLRKVKS